MPRGGRLAALSAALVATLTLGVPAGAQSLGQSGNQSAEAFQTGDPDATEPEPAERDPGDAVPTAEVVRYHSSDPYAMSIELASALVASAGGSSEWVVLASGESWAEAAAAGPLAVSLGAPVLLVPPGGLQTSAARPDLVEFLESAGTRRVVIVGNPEVLPNHEPSVLFGLGILPRNIERVHGTDAVGTAIAVAKRIGAPAEFGELGRTVIIANDQSVADAAAVGPLAAAGPFPLLLTAPDALDPRITAYLAEHEVEHVVLVGGTAAITPAARHAIEAANVTVTRLAGQNRYHTAALSMDLLAEVPRCADAAIDSIGLALGEEPLLALIAAQLLSPQCIPLLYTDKDRLAPITQNYLYLFRHRTGVEPNWHLIGDDVTIDPSAIEHPPVRMATVADNPDGNGQHIVVVDEHRQPTRYLLDAGFSWITQVQWSSDYEFIEFWGNRDDQSQKYLLDPQTAEMRHPPPRLRPWYSSIVQDDWIDPQPSTDRKYILYHASTAQHAGRSIFVYDVAAGASRMLTHNGTDDTHHVLRSRRLDDSRYFYFRQAILENKCYEEPSSEVGLLDIDESTINKLPFDGHVIDRDLSLSPERTHVVLAAYPEYAYAPPVDLHNFWFWGCTYYGLGIPQLLVYDISGSQPTLVSEARVDGFNPRWSPDGRHLVFQASSEENAGYSLFVLNLDTGNVDQVTLNDSIEYHHVLHHWLPDGDRFVYTAQRIEELENSCYGLVPEQMRRASVADGAAFVAKVDELTSTRIPFDGFAFGFDSASVREDLPGSSHIELGTDGDLVAFRTYDNYSLDYGQANCSYFAGEQIGLYVYDLSGDSPIAVSPQGLTNVIGRSSPDNRYIAYSQGSYFSNTVRTGYLILDTHTNSTWQIDPSKIYGRDARLSYMAWSKNSTHIVFRVKYPRDRDILESRASADVERRVLSALDLAEHSDNKLEFWGFSPDGWQVIHEDNDRYDASPWGEYGPKAGLLHVNSIGPDGSLIHTYDLFGASEPAEPAYDIFDEGYGDTMRDFAYRANWMPNGIYAAGYYYLYGYSDF